MTISTTTNRVTYTGNGVTVAFSFPYAFFAQADLVVVETIIATGAQTTKTITTHYTISGSVDALGHYSSGGTVTALTAPASTVTWTIYRDPAATQTTDLVENDPMPAESLEAALDYQTMLNQRTRDIATRALQQPEGDSATIDRLPAKVDRASMYLGFDADGDPIALDAPAGTTAVSAFMATVLDDTTGNAALATLGAAASDPRLVANTTHASNRRVFIDFQKSGTTKWLIANDQNAADANILTIYDGDAGAARLTINADGSVTLGAGQLKFPATQNASADANTLDDYEEGLWTPSVGGTATYTVQVGTYVKIGKQVTLTCRLIINAIGTGSTVLVSGVPFAHAEPGTGAVYFVSAAGNYTSMTAVNANTTDISFATLTAAGPSTSLGNAVFKNGTQTYFSLTYFV